MMDTVNFLRKFIRSPASIGSMVPSSPALVASMMAVIDWVEMDVIVELGAGTGVVTRAIDVMRHPQSVFFSFEKDEQMRHALETCSPDVNFGHDAFDMSRVLALHGHDQVDCVISCLPFANFRQTQQQELIRIIHDSLRPGGIFIAFQYSLQLQTCLKALYDEVDCRFVMLNFPPAFVYVCRK